MQAREKIRYRSRGSHLRQDLKGQQGAPVSGSTSGRVPALSALASALHGGRGRGRESGRCLVGLGRGKWRSFSYLPYSSSGRRSCLTSGNLLARRSGAFGRSTGGRGHGGSGGSTQSRDYRKELIPRFRSCSRSRVSLPGRVLLGEGDTVQELAGPESRLKRYFLCLLASPWGSCFRVTAGS
jgi:hypothetical protein